MSNRQSWVRDLLFRASRVKDAQGLEELQEEAAKKMGDDAVETGTSTGNTGEPKTTPEGESLHIHLHQPGGEGSAGAGGSASADAFPPPRPGGGAIPPSGGDPVLKAITDLSAKMDQLMSALGAGGGGGGGGGGGRTPPPDDDSMGGQWSDPEHDGDLDIHHSAMDAEGEERFEPDANKKIKVGGFGAETPPGASGGQNKGSADRRRGLRARDSSALVESWREMMALAEIINPGVRVPTFDRTMQATNTLDAMCKFRRRTLNSVYDADMDMHNLIDNLVDNPNGYSPTARMTCDSVSTLFRSVAQVKRQQNNAVMGRDALSNFPGLPNMGHRSVNPHEEALGIAALNRRNRDDAEKLWGTGVV